MSGLRDLLDLPTEVKKSDFVVQLADGVAHPGKLLDRYAITPGLLLAFEQALGRVGAALRERQSNGSYVHGSFGAGKSQYLAVLSLLLGNDATAWAEPAFHALRAKYEWTKEKKILRLHFHMVGARSIEEKLFSEYLARVRELHPGAPVPALFEDAALFDNAQRYRGELGEERFFAGLNAGGGDKGGWGKLSGSSWDGSSFDAARASGDPEQRAKLFSALVKTHFPAFAEGGSRFVEIDRGLAVLTRHAQALGYDALVFFLDELILWLAAGANNQQWLNGEMSKVAKLVESSDANRPVPVVSFIARQRDIADMVGDQFAGQDAKNLRETMKWWDGRFDTIRLEDRNLPAIVSKRVVRPKNEAARKELEGAFERMRGALGTVNWQELLGDSDEAAFKQVYPFSPKLVDALVALSQTLQRERTALKVMMELLVDHLEDFELGRLVAVGDLFDALAGGEEPMDGQMRQRFIAARRLYDAELLPVIRRNNGTDSREKCQRMREEHPVALGCSNCRELRCRGENRLVKTLLLAALVPQAKALADLTVSKLVRLNWGTLKAMVPGAEMTLAVSRLRQIATEVGKLSVGEGGDPLVTVRLEGLDLKPTLEQARGHDNLGARRRKLHEILFNALGLETGESLIAHKREWRGCDRRGAIQFGNVREMSFDALDAGDDDFKIVIDYPFDEQGRSPTEDEAKVDAFLEKHGSNTLVWLPSFLSDKVLRDLGELVVIDEVRRPDRFRELLGDKRAEDQTLARIELENLSSQKRQRVRRALEVAYGLRTGNEDELDQSRTVAQNFRLLRSDVEPIRALTASTFEKAVGDAVDLILERRYPRHPRFEDKVTPAKLTKALGHFEKLCASDTLRLPFEKHEVNELRIAESLGLVQLSEGAATLRPHRFQEADNGLKAQGIDTPTVAQAQAHLAPGAQGLVKEVSDFLVRAYALAGKREILRGGQPVRDVAFGKLPSDAELVKPPLPDLPRWQVALERAGVFFGISLGGKALHAANLRRFSEELEKKRDEARRLGAGEIAESLVKLEREGFFSGEPPRLQTALRVAELLTELQVKSSVAQVDVLAAIEPKTSMHAMGRHFLDAKLVAEALADPLVASSLASLRDNADPKAVALLAEVRSILEADQVNADAARLRSLALRAQGLNTKPMPPPPAGNVLTDKTGSDLQSLEHELEDLRRKVASAPGELAWALRVTRKQ